MGFEIVLLSLIEVVIARRFLFAPILLKSHALCGFSFDLHGVIIYGREQSREGMIYPDSFTMVL